MEVSVGRVPHQGFKSTELRKKKSPFVLAWKNSWGKSKDKIRVLMKDKCYQGNPTRSVLGSVHSKIAKCNLEKKVKNEARKSAQDTKLFGIVKCAIDCKQLWKDVTILSDEAIKSQIKFNENHK